MDTCRHLQRIYTSCFCILPLIKTPTLNKAWCSSALRVCLTPRLCRFSHLRYTQIQNIALGSKLLLPWINALLLKPWMDLLWGTSISQEPQRPFSAFICRLDIVIGNESVIYKPHMMTSSRDKGFIQISSDHPSIDVYLPCTLNTAPLLQINRLVWYYSSGTYRSVNVCSTLRQVRATFTGRFGSAYDLDLRA